MKKRLLYLMLGLCTFSLHAQNVDNMQYERHWKKGVEKVRVMSYNIFNGFNWGADKEREDRFVKWIQKQDPEFIGLQELCGFTQEKLEKLAARWGHPYAVIVKENGYPVGITSKKPITLKAKLVGEIGHGLLHVQTYGFDVLVTHLNPSNAAKRNVEAGKIVEYIKKNQLEDCILMGDMNSHSPMDADYLENNSTNLVSNYGGKNSPNLLDGKLDYSVISHFLSLPLIDICREYVPADKRNTFPTPILMNHSKQPMIQKRNAERLDYLLLTPSVAKKVVDAYIFNEGESEYLSDHFPIAVDFCIETQPKKK